MTDTFRFDEKTGMIVHIESRIVSGNVLGFVNLSA